MSRLHISRLLGCGPANTLLLLSVLASPALATDWTPDREVHLEPSYPKQLGEPVSPGEVVLFTWERVGNYPYWRFNASGCAEVQVRHQGGQTRVFSRCRDDEWPEVPWATVEHFKVHNSSRELFMVDFVVAYSEADKPNLDEVGRFPIFRVPRRPKEPARPATREPTPTAQPQDGPSVGDWVSTTAAVSVYPGPSRAQPPLEVPRFSGNVHRISDRQGGWCRLGTGGWASCAELKLMPASQQRQLDLEADVYRDVPKKSVVQRSGFPMAAKTTTSGLNVRSRPSPQGSRVHQFNRAGTELVLYERLGQADSWYRITPPQFSPVGWVSGNYIRMLPDKAGTLIAVAYLDEMAEASRRQEATDNVTRTMVDQALERRARKERVRNTVESRSARGWLMVVVWFLGLPFAVGMSLKYVLALDSGAGAVVASYATIWLLAYLVGSGWTTLFLVLTGAVLLYWTWLLIEYHSYASEGPEAPNPFLEPTTEALAMTKDDDNSLVPRAVPKSFTERALSRPLNPFVTRLQKKRAEKSAELLEAEAKLREAEGRAAKSALERDRAVARAYRGDKIIETDTFEDVAEHGEAALRAKKARAAVEDFERQREAKQQQGGKKRKPESLEERVGRAARAGLDLELVKAQTYRKELKRIEEFVAGEVEAGRVDPEDREDEIADLADSLRARLDQIAFDEEEA